MKNALVLRSGGLDEDDRKIIRLISFLGISYLTVDVFDAEAIQVEFARIRALPYCIVSSVDPISYALGLNGEGSQAVGSIIRGASSIYIYGFRDTDRCRAVLRHISGDPHANILPVPPESIKMTIAGGDPQLSGPMSGISAQIRPKSGDNFFQLSQESKPFRRILFFEGGDVFVAFEDAGLRFYLHACGAMVNLDGPIGSRKFDIRNFFCAAVPSVLYLAWISRCNRWLSPVRLACLIIDDPNLRPRYGFLHFTSLADLIRKHSFSATIAFIPWNWRRTHQAVVDLFKNLFDRLSLIVHGCDHTQGEFGTTSKSLLTYRARLATYRMDRMARTTGLTYDKIMVFPQGNFSPEALQVLKFNGYAAAVSTELAPHKQDASYLDIGTSWGLAQMQYSGFPIFSRRYPSEGIENFAFDILIGKPCLLVTHHGDFKDSGACLASVIDQLNALPCELNWGSMADVVSLAYQWRSDGDRIISLRIYSNHVRIVNSSPHLFLYKAEKAENDMKAIRSILVNNEAVAWHGESGVIYFSFKLNGGETAEVRIRYAEKPDTQAPTETAVTLAKVAIRRGLSELRDQYLSQNKLLNSIVDRIRKLLK